MPTVQLPFEQPDPLSAATALRAPQDRGPVHRVTTEVGARGKGGNGIARYARTDLTIGDAHICAGDLILRESGAANHDNTVFVDPDHFDLVRGKPANLTFGHGPRYCIGASLARLELQAVFTELTARVPTIRLAVPVEELHIHDDVLTGGLVALPVAW